MWCMLAAPLLAANDLTKMTPYVRSVLLHDELIAIDQDVLVSQAVVAKEGERSPSRLDQGWQLWKRPLHDGSTAVVVLNRGATILSLTVDFSEVGIGGAAKIRDVWARADLGKGRSLALTVAPHGTRTFKLTPTDRPAGIAPRVCDVARVRDRPRFTRPYVQLDCAVGEHIARVDRTEVGDATQGWRCGADVAPVPAVGPQHEAWEVFQNARAVCVGRRSCRVRLGTWRALALEGTCKQSRPNV